MVNEWQHLRIPFDDIKVATQNFKTLLGRGGYGSVYKGKLLVSEKETMVAVKRLNEQFGQGLKEFLTEIQLLSGQQHPNLISLVGYCDEGREKSIVYEYAERGSLDQYLKRTRKTTSLTWLQRLKICADAARGLDHLHRHVGSHRTIIHRDIKSSNILIDENWVGKISDLGLSKLSVTGFGMSVLVSNGCGTQGYCEPEYHTTGFVTKKSDVYSFGVVLFEVLCGRLCLIDKDDGFTLSSISAKKYYKNNTLDQIIDQSLREYIGSYSMTKFAAIAYKCLHDDREQRPAMDDVLKELEEALEDANDEYWQTKLPEDLDSLIKMFEIPHEVYTNKKELFSYLQKGTLFDEGSKFFWISDEGKKCLLISSSTFLSTVNNEGFIWYKKCLLISSSTFLSIVNNEGFIWYSDYYSRFKKVAQYSQKLHNVKFRIKTSMLSLQTMYEASLVFKYLYAQPTNLITIKWKINDLIVCSAQVAQRQDDNWMRIKMWRFWNHMPNAKFDIVIDEFSYEGRTDKLWIEGIEFEPVEMASISFLNKYQHERSVSLLDDDDDDDINDDEYWEKKLPENYQRYIEMSDKPLDYATKKELYHIFCRGFLADKGQLWFSVSKPTLGICSVQPANFSAKDPSQETRSNILPLPESRFGLVTRIDCNQVKYGTPLQSAILLSPQYTYACYLLFKFRDNSSVPDNTLLFRTECNLDQISLGKMGSYWGRYPINIPTIKSNNDQGSHDSSNILKAEGLAMEKDRTERLGYTWIEERKDGWMEAMLFKLTNKLQDQKNGCYLHIQLWSVEHWKVHGMIIEGIEFRPYI